MYRANFSDKKVDGIADLSKNCISANNLVECLRHCGEHHTSYKIYYSDIRIIEKIIAGQGLIARNNDYEDKVDLRNIQDCSDGFKRFMLCFTYSISENMAMWKIYNEKHNNALIKYSKDMLNKILQANADRLEIGTWNDKKYDRIGFVNKDDFGIEMVDVLYCDEKKSNAEKTETIEKLYYVKRADCSTHVSKSILAQMPKYMIKHNAWCFENETRLVVSVRNEAIAGRNVSAAKLVLPTDVIDTIKKDKIIVSPFNECGLPDKEWSFQKSSLCDSVKFEKK